MKAIIYARCSTDESRQDVENQLTQLKEYCDRQGWNYDVHWEYSSGSKQIPEKLRKILNLIKNRMYEVMVVYDLTRFSRLHPTTTNKMMDFITSHKCRFISIQENMDSYNEMTWLTIRHMFQYLSYIYSKNLSEKVKLGMDRKNKEIVEKGFTISKKTGKRITSIGRPKGAKDKKLRSKKGYYIKQREKLPF
jgi:DNA invertase Pin-like site-specific DNA recombinase